MSISEAQEKGMNYVASRLAIEIVPVFPVFVIEISNVLERIVCHYLPSMSPGETATTVAFRRFDDR